MKPLILLITLLFLTACREPKRYRFDGEIVTFGGEIDSLFVRFDSSAAVRADSSGEDLWEFEAGCRAEKEGSEVTFILHSGGAAKEFRREDRFDCCDCPATRGVSFRFTLNGDGSYSVEYRP